MWFEFIYNFVNVYQIIQLSKFITPQKGILTKTTIDDGIIECLENIFYESKNDWFETEQ